MITGLVLYASVNPECNTVRVEYGDSTLSGVSNLFYCECVKQSLAYSKTPFKYCLLPVRYFV